MSTESNFLILLVPFIAFVVFFSSILVIRSICIQDRRKSNWAITRNQRIDHNRRARNAAAASSTSSASVEVQTLPTPFVPPPRYYPPELTASESGAAPAMYPVMVPYYSAASSSSSLRDPRQFQGLPGLVAPPPYPEPPSYSQISAYPDLPVMSRLDNTNPSQSRAAGLKKGETIAPVE